MKAAVFSIDGMRCEACANSIKSLIEKQVGVRSVAVSFGERQARVLYDPQVLRQENLIETIQASGFRVVSTEPAE